MSGINLDHRRPNKGCRSIIGTEEEEEEDFAVVPDEKKDIVVVVEENLRMGRRADSHPHLHSSSQATATGSGLKDREEAMICL
eukprot:scaffold12819_cov104-Skeletonema_dohrnii-CCMP3373.AAC.4